MRNPLLTRIPGHLSRAALVGVALALSACATDRFGADVTRFHLNQQLARGTVFLEPVDPAQASSLEFRTYAAEVADELRRLGFTPVDRRDRAEFIGVMNYGQTSRQSLGSRSPVSIGIGGGSWGDNVGVGLGTTFGLGGGRPRDLNVNMLSLQLKRASDMTTIWEGRAVSEMREGSSSATLSGAMPLLADALFSNFPGPSGQTTRYRPS